MTYTLILNLTMYYFVICFTINNSMWITIHSSSTMTYKSDRYNRTMCWNTTSRKTPPLRKLFQKISPHRQKKIYLLLCIIYLSTYEKLPWDFLFFFTDFLRPKSDRFTMPPTKKEKKNKGGGIKRQRCLALCLANQFFFFVSEKCLARGTDLLF